MHGVQIGEAGMNSGMPVARFDGAFGLFYRKAKLTNTQIQCSIPNRCSIKAYIEAAQSMIKQGKQGVYDEKDLRY